MSSRELYREVQADGPDVSSGAVEGGGPSVDLRVVTGSEVGMKTQDRSLFGRSKQ